jgi:hypothetical protein
MRGMLRTPVGRVGQRMVLHLRHRQPGGDEVAEALALPVRIELVDRGAEEQLEAGQQCGQHGRLVVAGIAAQARVVDRDLLQAQHVEVGQRARARRCAAG